MFIREFKVRSNNQIKSSEKKGFVKEILKQYPNVDEAKLKELINVKDSEIVLSKIQTHDGHDLVAYFVDKSPLFFKIEKQDELIPTVYFLWKFPDLFPKFFTYREVYSKLLNGADLMLPGVITKEAVNLYTFKHINKNALCSICVKGNSVPIGIGRAFMSGEDMYMSAMRGKCLVMLQLYQDNLWSAGDRNIPMPTIPVVEEASSSEQSASASMNDENVDSSATEKATTEENLEATSNADDTSSQSQIGTAQESPKSASVDASSAVDEQKDDDLPDATTSKAIEVEDHDQLLYDAFMIAIRYKLKEIKLPIIVSTFMKIMQQASGSDPSTQFDLKKTQYKKMNNFIKEMELKGIIKASELQKGVLSITSINKESEIYKTYRKPKWYKEKETTDAATTAAEATLDELIKSMTIEINEMHKVDGNVEELFRPKFKKGDILTSAEIRQYLTNYIKEKQLQSPEKPRFFKLNSVLNKIVFNNKRQLEYPNGEEHPESLVTFEDLFSTLFNKMTHMHQIKRSSPPLSNTNPIHVEQSQIRKGKFTPIEFKLENRGGNKKMTAVYNLAPFHFDVEQLKNKIRKLVGCSVTINELDTVQATMVVTTTAKPSSATPSEASANPAEDSAPIVKQVTNSVNELNFVLFVQGNQINQVAELLKGEFGIPHKYMAGLDLGVKQ